MMVLLSVGIVLVATAAIWLGSGWLEDASARLAAHYDLPPVVQGGLIAAVGSSFPELSTVVIAGLAGSFGLGVGAVVGSAIFNILVIPGLAGALAKDNLTTNRTVVHKETLFYVLSVVVFFLTLALAVVYNPGENRLRGTVTRPLVVFPLLVYGLYLFLQWQDTTEYGGRPETFNVDVRKEFGLLVVGLLVILVAVEQLVDAVLVIGAAIGTPDFLWGITVVAAATSLPDLLVSVQAAGREHHVASVSNVIGSNIFDLLVVVPVGILIVGSTSVQFGLAAPLLVCLLVVTVLLFVLLRTDLLLAPWEAYLLLLTYGVFILWVGAETLGVSGLLPDA
ncbi:MAG: sodium:calcium antiporter [Halovenus sp.]